jgi:hypothetical protein
LRLQRRAPSAVDRDLAFSLAGVHVNGQRIDAGGAGIGIGGITPPRN